MRPLLRARAGQRLHARVIGGELSCRSGIYDDTIVEHVGVVGDLQAHARVLLHQQDGNPFIAHLRDEGISVLLVEQNARMSLAIADHAFVLDHGTIVYGGPAKELAADEERVQALAGASAEDWHDGAGDAVTQR